MLVTRHGTLAKVLVNGRPHVVAAETSVAALLEELGLAGRPLAVEVNGGLVTRARHGACRLADGDRLEIVTLVGGG
jgi:sulfur carrier protein